MQPSLVLPPAAKATGGNSDETISVHLDDAPQKVPLISLRTARFELIFQEALPRLLP